MGQAAACSQEAGERGAGRYKRGSTHIALRKFAMAPPCTNMKCSLGTSRPPCWRWRAVRAQLMPCYVALHRTCCRVRLPRRSTGIQLPLSARGRSGARRRSATGAKWGEAAMPRLRTGWGSGGQLLLSQICLRCYACPTNEKSPLLKKKHFCLEMWDSLLCRHILTTLCCRGGTRRIRSRLRDRQHATGRCAHTVLPARAGANSGNSTHRCSATACTNTYKTA